MNPAKTPSETAVAEAEGRLEQAGKPVAVFVPNGQQPPEGFVPLKQSGLNRQARRRVQATLGRQARKQAGQRRRAKHLNPGKTCDVWKIMEELHFGK